MAGIKFDITGDNKNVLDSFNGVQQGVRRMQSAVEKSGNSIESMFQRVQNAATASLAGFSVKEFVQKVAQVRGEFQQLEVAFTTMLDSASKAEALVAQLTRTAAITPFGLEDVAGGAKQLLAYGIAAEEVNDTLIHLGDIAAGLSLPLTDLVYLYGTTMTQGRMFTQDLRQFQGRGVPIAEELAKVLGVTKDKVGELVTAGKVGADEFKKAIMSMSSEGGKFGGLMEAQSKTITGQISNLEDAIDVMFNEIGKQNEGFINDAVSGVSYLVEHYREVGSVLLTLISTYGLYKAALIATNAVQGSMQKVEYGKQIELLQKEIEETQKLLPEKMKAANADLAEMVARKQLTEEQAQHIILMRQEKQELEQSVKANGIKDALDAQKAALEELLSAKEKSKNADLDEMVASGQLSQEMANEIVKKREALEATLSLVNARKKEVDTQLEAAQTELSTAQQNEQIAQNRHKEAERSVTYYEKQLEAVKALGDGEQIEAAENALNTAVSSENAAAKELQAAQTATATAEERVNTLAKEQNAILTALDTEATGANTVSRATNTKATTANTTATTGSTFAMKLNAIGAKAAAAANAILTTAINGVKNAFDAMKVALMTNPIGAVVGALSLAIGLFATFDSKASEASAEVERFGENAVKQTRNLETLLAVVDSTSANSKVHRQAVDELCKIYEEYGYKIDDEIDKLEQLKLMHDLVTDAIRKEGEERQKANLLASYEEALNKATESMRNDLKDAFENAEWDGSGTFDGFDAEEYQKKAEELTQIIGAIIQSESESLATLTGDELESKIQEVNERIKKAYQDMGLQLSKSFIKSGGTIGASGYTIDAPVDVDAIKIMRDYAEATHSVVQGRQSLIDSFNKGKDVAEEETKAVEYSTMSIADLAKAASDASEEVNSLGDKNASPEVDASSVEGAGERAAEAKDSILQLHGLSSKPLIDTSSINAAIGQSNTLLGNMMQLQNNPVFKTVFGVIGGKPVSMQIPNIPITGPQILARNEMNRRVGEANSQSKVDELMKEVNAALNDATFDSDLYKYLEGVKKQLESKSRKKKKTSDSNKAANERAQRVKAEQKYQELLRKQRVDRERAARDLELSTSQAQIDAMEEGSQKTLAQITLDFEKQREEIKRGYEDLRQKKIDEARRLFEANPANKGKAFNESSVNTEYTEEERNNFEQLNRANRQNFVRQIASMELPDLPQSYIQDRIKQIKEAYQKEIDDIAEEERKLKEQQGGTLTKAQQAAFYKRTEDANTEMQEGVKDLEDAEVERAKQKYKALLDEYKSYDQKRRDIDKQYNEDMALYNAKRKEIADAGGDTTDIDASMGERTKQYKQDIQDLQDDILESSDFYTKLFGDISSKGYKVLKGFYAQAQETMDNARTLADGVEIDVTVKDADGKFVKKAVKVTVEEFQKMKDKVKEIRDELDKENPFAAFKTAWSDLKKAMKNDGDVQGSLKKLNEKGKELTSTIQGWGDSLGAVFGDSFAQSIQEMMTMVDSVMDMGTGIAQIYSGDIVGGITNTLSGISSIVSLFTSWKEKMEEMQREWYIAEIETARSLREQAEEYAGMRSTISDIIKGTEELNWLIEHGMAKVSTVSLWTAQNEQLVEYKKSLTDAQHQTDELWNKVRGERGEYSWGNSLNGGSESWSLANANEEQLELWYNQNKLSDAAKQYYEAWKASGESVEELRDKIAELYANMREEVMGVNFDSWLSNVISTLKSAKGDVKDFADFTEDTIVDALMNAFMYQHLASMMEPLYNKLSEALIKGEADKEFLDNWEAEFQEKMAEANAQLDSIAEMTGRDPRTADPYEQSGTSGGWQSMGQETADELNGRFTALQMSGEIISEGVTAMMATLASLSALADGRNITLVEIRNLMITNNAYLEDILNANKEYYKKFDTKLDKIVTQTK